METSFQSFEVESQLFVFKIYIFHNFMEMFSFLEFCKSFLKDFGESDTGITI